jgi:hypothetical protein
MTAFDYLRTDSTLPGEGWRAWRVTVHAPESIGLATSPILTLAQRKHDGQPMLTGYDPVAAAIRTDRQVLTDRLYAMVTAFSKHMGMNDPHVGLPHQNLGLGLITHLLLAGLYDASTEWAGDRTGMHEDAIQVYRRSGAYDYHAALELGNLKPSRTATPPSPHLH